MKIAILVAALALSGCTATHLSYALGTGPSPQRVQELEAQRVQERYEQDRAAERAEHWRTRCTRISCKTDEELRPKRYSCGDDNLTSAQRLACNLPGMTVTTDISGNITELGVE